MFNSMSDRVFRIAMLKEKMCKAKRKKISKDLAMAEESTENDDITKKVGEAKVRERQIIQMK